MPPGNRLAPASPNYLQNAGQFVGGVGRGLSNQFATGPLSVVQQSWEDPYSLGQGIVMGAQQFAQDPVGSVKNSLREMWTRAKSSPAGLGEVVGENIDPRNWLKPRKAIIAGMADEIPTMPYERAKRLFDDIKNRYVKGEMSFEEYSDRSNPLQKIIFDAERKARFAETKGKPIPVFEDLMHIPEGTRLTVRQRSFPYEGTETAKVVGTHVLQTKGYGLQRLPIVEYADGRTRRLIDSDIIQVHMPRAAKLPAAD